ncbi:TPA: transglycosylase SLT domain-containing protein [Campylobacter fetus subsp. venerealis]|nr:transglycosylase SLT domain-containing protein [Campylobacter fetus subsp. venerealis]HDX6253959.1 transglycosylase SLT domain-containing protein [Campylobacter fetus subsp. venerealis]HDX6258147.1 transglycosylase SLT domain-containing protein [Campylobacter fetus subsp. venerealis]HDX6261806.1 transglycosylase SLT domain-containing protein [Campylobacter fetus subsp. venerealis]HDX6263936.1 transglycosylase SLT domain-containing protein [Campylobacter fetus subsp. venerealis]
MIKKGLLITLFLVTFLRAEMLFDIRQEIADSLKVVANDSGIDVRILYTIAKTESDFKPYIISFLISDYNLVKNLKNGFKNSIYEFRYSKYDKKRYAVSVSSHNKEAIKELAIFFWDFDFNVDFGLMQISKQNLKKDELDYIFNPEYNVKKSKEILTMCANKYLKAKDAIECYNKGFAPKKSYNYYAKFINHYNIFFGDDK